MGNEGKYLEFRLKKRLKNGLRFRQEIRLGWIGERNKVIVRVGMKMEGCVIFSNYPQQPWRLGLPQ